MMSVNQLSVYHTLIETYNIVYKASSEKIRRKIVNNCQEGYNLRSNTNNDLFVLSKTRANCQGFSCFAAKLFNKLPIEIRNSSQINFKKSRIYFTFIAITILHININIYFSIIIDHLGMVN